MVAGKRSRGKQRQRWEKDITDTFGTDGNSKQSGGGPASISQRHLGSDVLTRICSEKIRKKMNQYRLSFVCGYQYRLLYLVLLFLQVRSKRRSPETQELAKVRLSRVCLLLVFVACWPSLCLNM